MTERKEVKPYGDDSRSKKEEVAAMFNNISKRYDFLNHFLSLGIDKIWRRKAVNLLKEIKPNRILDLATGTGDFAIASLRLNPKEVIGMDISEGMLEVGREKMRKNGFDQVISMRLGDSENLPFEDNYFDALTVGFGVRNYEHLEKGLAEMLRVVRPGGKLVILEFSKQIDGIKKIQINACNIKDMNLSQLGDLDELHLIYTIDPQDLTKALEGVNAKKLILSGDVVSENKAYAYLPESVAAFPEGRDFELILEKLGYKTVQSTLVAGGIATIYTGIK